MTAPELALESARQSGADGTLLWSATVTTVAGQPEGRLLVAMASYLGRDSSTISNDFHFWMDVSSRIVKTVELLN
jgi:hypothetical protein